MFFKFTNKSLDLWTSRNTFAGNLGEISGHLRTSPNIEAKAAKAEVEAERQRQVGFYQGAVATSNPR